MTDLSVIIPTRNRARHLSGALNALAGQTFPLDCFEVIVIDNGSSDNTYDVCRSFANRVPRFHYYYASTPGLHVGRHLGMNMAKADILVYADDDIEAFPTWLEGIFESFQETNVVLAGGKILPKYEQEPPRWILRMWQRDKSGRQIIDPLSLMDLGDKVMPVDPGNIYGCNFSVRRSVLEEAEGFHPDALPEHMLRFRGDGETHISGFVRKRGYTALYHPKASVFHVVPEERLTEAYFCKRAYLQGISDSYTHIRNAARESVSLTQRMISYLRLSQKRWRMYSDDRRRRIEHDYYKGFCMHQDAVRKDKTLYEWVVRRHYMDIGMHEPFSKAPAT